VNSDFCVFCYGQENGKPVTVCSRCLQKLAMAPQEKISAVIQKYGEHLDSEKLYFLKTALEDTEVNYEFKTRKHRRNLAGKRTGRTSQPTRQRIRQVRPSEPLDSGRATVC
jgi:hypothetical protein